MSIAEDIRKLIGDDTPVAPGGPPGPDAKKLDSYLTTLLSFGGGKEEIRRMLKDIISKPYGHTAPYKLSDKSPLNHAIEVGSMDIVKIFLAIIDRSSINNIGLDQRETALSTAVGCGNLEVVKLLLSHGANPNVINKYNDTPLTIAFARQTLDDNDDCKNEEIIKCLLNAGADVNYFHKSVHGDISPFIVALRQLNHNSQHNVLRYVRILIEHGLYRDNFEYVFRWKTEKDCPVNDHFVKLMVRAWNDNNTQQPF